MKYLPGATTPKRGQEAMILGCECCQELKPESFLAMARPTELGVYGSNEKYAPVVHASFHKTHKGHLDP